MDNNRFFPNYWVHPSHPYYYYYHYPPPPDPIHHYPQPVHVAAHPRPSPSTSKVVQIPVCSSEQPTRSRPESALRIQKAFRGFLVRKSLEKIKSIKSEVEDIEKRVSRREYVEFLKENEKERVKVNEMLMNLLLKLDSIRGFEFGVRECRKSVIKKAICLQERVDALVSSVRSDEVADNVFEEKHEALSEIEDPVEECGEEESSGERRNGAIEDEDHPFDKKQESIEEGGRQDSSGNNNTTTDRELMEKMMKMMNQLYERSEMQTQMLTSLTLRVEQLEKAFMCERLRRKKKKNNHAA